MDSGTIGAVTGIFSLIISTATLVFTERRLRRDSVPAFEWNGSRLRVDNHLKEFVHITHVQANCGLSVGDYEVSPAGSIERYIFSGKRVDVAWSVPPASVDRFTLMPETDTIDRVWVTVRTSGGTIKRKKVLVRRHG